MIAELEDLVIEAQPLRHAVDCYGYRIQERDRVRFVPALLAAAQSAMMPPEEFPVSRAGPSAICSSRPTRSRPSWLKV